MSRLIGLIVHEEHKEPSLPTEKAVSEKKPSVRKTTSQAAKRKTK